jgi:hypothetical protein
MATVEYIAEGIDRLITLDLRARGVIYKLYEGARKLTGIPLTLAAAQRIKEVVKEGDTVLITTGFRVPPSNIQETDGPLGAAAIAYSLNVAFEAKPLIITEEISKEILKATIQGIGMNVIDEKTGKAIVKHTAIVGSFPLEIKAAEEKAKVILDENKPSLVMAIEKAGRNSKGEYHTMRGLNVTSLHAKVEPLIEEARKRGILTIGIGDGGNEVGMGNIKEVVEKFVPYAQTCQCPCKGGIAAESKVDILVTAAISNWGAYGIEACIAHITGKPEALHTQQQESSMLQYATKAGAIDGVTGHNEPSVDGVPGHIHPTIISILEALIKK